MEEIGDYQNDKGQTGRNTQQDLFGLRIRNRGKGTEFHHTEKNQEDKQGHGACMSGKEQTSEYGNTQDGHKDSLLEIGPARHKITHVVLLELGSAD